MSVLGCILEAKISILTDGLTVNFKETEIDKIPRFLTR
jgi:hypothetical protein